MKSAILAATVLALGVYAQSEVKINTPTSLVQCQPIKVSWTGGQAPYYISAIPGGQASAAPLKDFGKQDGNELTWIVDLPAGTSISMQAKDSTGAVNYASEVTIQAGSDTSCLNGDGAANVSGGAAAGGAAASGGSSGAASSGGAAAAPAAGSASSGGAAASGASKVASAGSAATSGAASAASGAAAGASSAAASSAGRIVASSGFVGAAALIVAALL